MLPEAYLSLDGIIPSLSLSPLPISKSFTSPLHLLCGFPLPLLPYKFARHPLLTNLSSPILSICPNHFNTFPSIQLIRLIKYPSTPHSSSTLHSASLQTLFYAFFRSMQYLPFLSILPNQLLQYIHLIYTSPIRPKFSLLLRSFSFVLSMTLLINTLPYSFPAILNIPIPLKLAESLLSPFPLRTGRLIYF